MYPVRNVKWRDAPTGSFVDALFTLSVAPSAQGRQEAALGSHVIALALEQAPPAGMACEMFRGHAIEAAHPGFQAAVTGVRVLPAFSPPAP